MSSAEIQIKNMVCPRCIEAVKKSLEENHIEFDQIELGRVTLPQPILESKKETLAKSLLEKGFELLETRNAVLIAQIKAVIIQHIHHQEDGLGENFSSILSDQLQHEYTSLSRIFSQVEGITIEKYITRQKIERIKEFIFYDQWSLSEIANYLGYSSVAYLSAQFKKETGMTPSEFKKSRIGKRKSLDQV